MSLTVCGFMRLSNAPFLSAPNALQASAAVPCGFLLFVVAWVRALPLAIAVLATVHAAREGRAACKDWDCARPAAFPRLQQREQKKTTP